MNNKTQIASNCLSQLLGDYNSDSDNEDAHTPKMVDKVDELFSELNTEIKIISTSWTECIDKNTGHPYYWNTATKEVTWELPEEYNKYLKKNVANIKNKNNENIWIIRYGEDKVPYYVNEYTRKVSWERPPGFVDHKLRVIKKKHKKAKPKSMANDIKNGKSDKVEKSSKKYPFLNDDIDDEKIELITSFSAKSDSSSGDESIHTEKKHSKKKNSKLKLVAEYNSDDNSADDVGLRTKTLVKSFVDPILPLKIYSIKTDLTETAITTVQPSLDLTNEKVTIPKVNTFASIITGGRSPDHVQSNYELMLSDTETETKCETSTEIEVNTKVFKRKRRIEFNTTPFVCPIQSKSPLNVDETANMAMVYNELSTNKNSDEKTSISTYTNVQQNQIESVRNESSNDNVIIENNLAQKEEVSNLKNIIEAKLKFLCDGRPDVSAVQAIMIQLETLTEAYEEQALQASYILKWLEAIASDLMTLEKDAAPPGWKCLWNRKKSQYCYKNISTGEMQWEYPELDVKTDEDEMDICTTPPPNIGELLTEEPLVKRLKEGNDATNITPEPPEWNSSELVLPPPPKISGEPLPPGIDPSEYDTHILSTPSEAINSELASFYSDLATIETTSNPGIDEQTPIASNCDSIKAQEIIGNSDNTIKKKKKKIKKLEPWRSGNLETWINKWQKAQKELDG